MNETAHNNTILNSLRASIGESISESARSYNKYKGRFGPRVSVEISRNTIKGVVAEDHMGSRIIQSFFQYEVPEAIKNNEKERKRALGLELKRFLKAAKTQNFICVLSSSKVRTSVVELPPLSHNDSIYALSAKALKQIGTSSEDWTAKVVKTSSTDTGESPKNEYLLITIPQSEQLELVEIFHIAQAVPCTIMLPSTLYSNLISIADESIGKMEDDQEPTVWVIAEMRRNSTTIHIYSDGSLEYTRTIPFGGDMLTNALRDVVATPAGFVELSFEGAEALKKEVGLPAGSEDEDLEYDTLLNGAQIYMMLEPKLKSFVFELRNSTRYYQQKSGNHRIHRLVLTGGSSLLNGLDDYVHKNLKIRPYHFDTSDTNLILRQFRKEETDFVFSHCSPLCASLQSGGITSNMLPRLIRWENLLRKPCRIATITTMIISMILVVIAFKMRSGFADERNTVEQMNRFQSYQQEISSLDEEINSIKNHFNDLISDLGYSIPITELLADISRRTSPNAVLTNISIENSFTTHKITVYGKIASVSGNDEQPVMSLIESYMESPFVKEVTNSSLNIQSVGNDGPYSFTFDIVPYVIAPKDQR